MTQDDENDNKSTNVANIYKVSVKYVQFNKDDPEIWFKQLEAQFGLSGITVEDTKYGHLIAALDPQTTKHVREKILNPPAQNKYSDLKKAILERIGDSDKIKLDRLLSGLQLGDKKPSQLLREMQALAEGRLNEPVLKNLWLQRLPTNVQEILSCLDGTDIEKMAVTADKISEIHKPPEVMTVSNKTVCPNNSVTRSQFDLLYSRVESLSNNFDRFCRVSEKAHRSDNNENARNRSRSSEHNKYRTRSTSRSEKEVRKHPNCWYHYKFGSRARKCIPPCEFNPTKNSENY